MRCSSCTIILSFILFIYSSRCSAQLYNISLDGIISNNEWPPAVYKASPGYWGVAMKTVSSNSFFVAVQYNSTQPTGDVFAIALDFNTHPATTATNSITCRGVGHQLDFRATSYLCWNGTSMEIYVANSEQGYTFTLNATLSSFYHTVAGELVTWEMEIPYNVTQDPDIMYNSPFGNTVLFHGLVTGPGISVDASSSHHGFFLNTGFSPGIASQFPQFYETYPYVFTASVGVWNASASWLNSYIAADPAYTMPPSVLISGGATLYDKDRTVCHLALFPGSRLTIADGRQLAVEGVLLENSFVYISSTATLNGTGFLQLQAPAYMYCESSVAVISVSNMRLTGSGPLDNSLINLNITGQLVFQKSVTLNRKVQYAANSALVYNNVTGGSLEWPGTTDVNRAADLPYIPYDVKFVSCLPSCQVQVPNNTYLLAKRDVIAINSDVSITETYEGMLLVNKNFNVTIYSTVSMRADLQVGGRIFVDSTSALSCDDSTGGKYFVGDSTGSFFKITPGLAVCSNFGCQNITSENSLYLVPPGNISVALINETALSDFAWRNTSAGNTTAMATCAGNPTCTFAVTTSNQTIRFIAKEATSKCYAYFTVVLRGDLSISPSATPSSVPSATPSPEVDETASSSPSPNHLGETPTSTKSKDSPVALIAGVVVGGVALIAGAIIAGILIKRRIDKQRKPDSDKSDIELSQVGSQPAPPESKRQSKADRDWEIPFTELDLGKELGRGAFGVVFKCRWRNTDCVVKQLDINRTDQQSVKQFLKEADNVKGLRPHTNVCNVFGICTDPAYPICIVMEYLPDGSLDQLVYKNKIGLDAKMILDFAKDIASGMSHIHHENVLHCDLACRNLLLTARGVNKYTVKIADFGLSRVTETETYNVSTTTSFPVRWTAPETLQSGKITRASDVWSFGVVLWEIAEGKRPYPDLSNSEVIKAVCDKGVRLPRPERVQIQDELWDLMNHCWDAEPENRPNFNEIYSQLCKIEDNYFGEEDEPAKLKSDIIDQQDNYNSGSTNKDYYNNNHQKDYYNTNVNNNDQ